MFCIPETATNSTAAADPRPTVGLRRKDARRSFLGLEVQLAGVPAERVEALVREAWITQAPKRVVAQHTASMPS